VKCEIIMRCVNRLTTKCYGMRVLLQKMGSSVTELGGRVKLGFSAAVWGEGDDAWKAVTECNNRPKQDPIRRDGTTSYIFSICNTFSKKIYRVIIYSTEGGRRNISNLYRSWPAERCNNVTYIRVC